MQETMGKPFDSLSNYTQIFDERLGSLQTFLGALQGIEGRMHAHLHGPFPKTDGTVPSTSGPVDTPREAPSLESNKNRFDELLKELGQVVENLARCVEPQG